MNKQENNYRGHISKGARMTDESLDNEALWKLYSPKSNPWFSSKITYKGWGTATFEKPVGTIEGPTKITVDETGELKIEMKYKKLHTDITVYGTGSVKFIKFVQGNIGSKETENQISWGSGSFNPCSKLTVKTRIGTFTSSGKVICSPGFGLDNNLKFHISKGIFEVNSAKIVKYWVVPLINFVSTFHMETHPLLTQHPLRLFSTPTVPEFSDEKQTNTALFIANRANLLIFFYLGEKLGYIQPIFDYGEKEEKLKAGQLSQCITALMVGEIIDSVDDERFPYDYIKLLSLISETEVGASWIEFRDDSGELIKVKYIASKKLTYHRKYAVIDEAFYGGIGNILTAAYNSPEFREGYCQALISHLIGLSSFNYNIEDRMALIGRGLDAVCKKLDIKGRKLSYYLPDNYHSQVNLVLTESGGKLRRLSREAKKENLINESNALLQLSKKVEQIANNKDGEFGLKVVELLRYYNFVDAEIMERYYSSKTNTQMSWFQTLSQYRNIVIHEGYFHFQEGTHNFQEISSVEDHLHDLMVRIVLKILNYQGKYQPRVKPYLFSGGKTVDWVTYQTTAAELGYSEAK